MQIAFIVLTLCYAFMFTVTGVTLYKTLNEQTSDDKYSVFILFLIITTILLFGILAWLYRILAGWPVRYARTQLIILAGILIGILIGILTGIAMI